MAINQNIQGFNYAQSLIPIFDGESYDYWSLQMKTLFISQDLWDFIEEGYKVPESAETLSSWTDAEKKEYKENKKKDAKALLFLQQGVSKAIFPRISVAKTSQEAWNILKVAFQGSEKVISIKLQNLWRDFDNLLMKENETIQNFFSRVTGIVNQISSYGDTIENKRVW